MSDRAETESERRLACPMSVAWVGIPKKMIMISNWSQSCWIPLARRHENWDSTAHIGQRVAGSYVGTS